MTHAGVVPPEGGWAELCPSWPGPPLQPLDPAAGGALIHLSAKLQELKSRLERKQLPDGTPMRAARVTFLDRETAERAMRPLIDVGAQLQYYRQDGEEEPLRE